ncbi:arylsulfatase [Gayadomonas joobiniege]|uniref:arylsulfatase n=1 Tax=Gayadomonas joobiniege TaxID=1234606 RepID=UPI0003781047|nr:arylsulfatase [Gayadomonas joobiniege]
MNYFRDLIALLLIVTTQIGFSQTLAKTRPNVIVILTDDQGYGDLAATGNPWLKTPNLDALAEQSLQFTDFHVDPTCSPTRAALMTGKYSTKVGVWLTYASRHHLAKGEMTMADVFKNNDYETAIFGKWHLGDNYPYRPQDRGFKTSFIHGGGSISETPDYWGNDLYDDIYFRNGEPEQANGYATDVWFNETIDYIEQNRNNPFFIYLSLNAPHSPLNVPEKYAKPYRNNPEIPDKRANFYGMIANIDENIGRLRNKLRALSIEQNTILLFLNDNGTGHGVTLADIKGKKNANGWVKDGYNAGMRGRKGSVYKGGHRAFLYLHWPAGGYKHQAVFEPLTAHFDILPTLIDMCGLNLNQSIDFDGISLAPYLTKNNTKQYPQRTLFVHHQGRENGVDDGHLVKFQKYAVLTDNWRMVNTELYQASDIAQKNDLSTKYPKVMAQLNKAYLNWWQEIEFADDSQYPFVIYPEKQYTTVITPQNLLNIGQPAYSQFEVRRARMLKNGYSYIDVQSPGEYKITLSRWPRELNLAADKTPDEFELDAKKHHKNYYFYRFKNKAIQIERAYLTIGDKRLETKALANAISTEFIVNLPSGLQKISAWFTTANQQTGHYYYLYIEPNSKQP